MSIVAASLRPPVRRSFPGRFCQPFAIPLEGLTRDEFVIRYEPALYGYLHRLDGLNFIQPMPGLGLIDIEKQHKADERLPVPPHERPAFDLKKFVYITDEGRNYLSILQQRKAVGS